jgi:hypothetical protein
MNSARWRWALYLTLSVLLASCGGGGADTTEPTQPPVEQAANPRIIVGDRLPQDIHWQPPTSATPSTGNYVYLQSVAGDEVGRGETMLYTDVESTLVWEYQNGVFGFSIGSTHLQWSGRFTQSSREVYPLEGFYGNATLPDLRSVQTVGMLWRTEARRCDSLSGWYVVDELESGSNGIERLVIRFAQYCNGSSTPLRGKVSWVRAQQRLGPIQSPPSGLWQPPVAAVPAAGTYLYVESDQGDYVGAGRSALFKPDNAELQIYSVDAFIRQFSTVYVTSGSTSWSGSFFGMNQVKLQRGYYPGVQRYPLDNVQVGAMGWSQNGRSCGAVNGWFMVDEVTYFEDFIVYLELRFEQRCDDARSALRGKLRWSVLDVLPPAGPSELPADLWQPAPGSVPSVGDYLYVESGASDAVGQGVRRLYTSGLRGTPYNASFRMQVQGDILWVGDFATMGGVSALQTGYYPALQALPRRDSSSGAQSWSADGRTCVASAGWTAIDRIEKSVDGSISLIELRFEQRCAGATDALRGKLRWSALESGVALGVDPPAHLWQPPQSGTSAQGNYLYVESDQADAIGQGRSVLLTEGDYLFGAQVESNMPDNPRSLFGLYVDQGHTNGWGVGYQAPRSHSRLLPGLYGNLRAEQRSLGPFGALIVSSGSRSCGALSTGWVAVDSVLYEGDRLAGIEMRFEQHCDGTQGAVRGKLRWLAADVRQPPGPAYPSPADLWRPAAGLVPGAGNYMILESTYGDFIGQARTRVLTPDSTDFRAYTRSGGPSGSDSYIQIDMTERDKFPGTWSAVVVGIRGMRQLQRGYYDNATRAGFHNGARGGIEVTSPQSACNSVTGWFAIDDVVYEADELRLIEMRFEQRCEGVSAPLRGTIRWQRPQ